MEKSSRIRASVPLLLACLYAPEVGAWILPGRGDHNRSTALQPPEDQPSVAPPDPYAAKHGGRTFAEDHGGKTFAEVQAETASGEALSGDMEVGSGGGDGGDGGGDGDGESARIPGLPMTPASLGELPASSPIFAPLPSTVAPYPRNTSTLTVCALFTLRYEAPYLLPWLANQFLMGVDRVNLYHDDTSASWDPKLVTSHAGVYRILRNSARVNLFSMKELNLTSQEDQIRHCDHSIGAAAPCDTGPDGAWVGNWDIDEALTTGLSIPDAPRVGEGAIKKLLRKLPPWVLGVPLPRAVMGASHEHDLPAEGELEYEQYTMRRYFSTKGKSLWRSGCHVHPTFSSHVLMAESRNAFAYAGGGSGPEWGPQINALGYDETDESGWAVPVSVAKRQKNAHAFKRHWETAEAEAAIAAAAAAGSGDGNVAVYNVYRDAKRRARNREVVQGCMYSKGTLHRHMSKWDATLPSFAVDLRLNHYSGRSVTECARKAALASSGTDIFGSAKAREARCSRADFLDNATMREPDHSLAKYAPKINEAIREYFGPSALAVVERERKWYRAMLQTFKGGGTPDF